MHKSTVQPKSASTPSRDFRARVVRFVLDLLMTLIQAMILQNIEGIDPLVIQSFINAVFPDQGAENQLLYEPEKGEDHA